MLTQDYSGEQAYCQSKLALVAFGFSLSRVLNGVSTSNGFKSRMHMKPRTTSACTTASGA